MGIRNTGDGDFSLCALPRAPIMAVHHPRPARVDGANVPCVSPHLCSKKPLADRCGETIHVVLLLVD
jgi:hypothetical protein